MVLASALAEATGGRVKSRIPVAAGVNPAAPADRAGHRRQNPKLPARLAVAGSHACARQGRPKMSSTVRVIE